MLVETCPSSIGFATLCILEYVARIQGIQIRCPVSYKKSYKELQWRKLRFIYLTDTSNCRGDVKCDIS